MHVAIIGGASTIGSSIAYALTTYRQDIDISLVDINEDAAGGHATDLRHGAYHWADAPGAGGGQIRALHTEDIESISPDVAVVAADKPRHNEGQLDDDFRDETIDRIEDMLEDITEQLRAIGPLPVINISNPLDRVTYYFWKQLGWDRRYVFGYSLSETSRVADAIAQERDVHPNRVYCPTLGEHGEHAVLAFSRATIDGEAISLTDAEKERIQEYVQTIPVRIANARGVRDSSRWVTSAGVLRLIRAMDDGGSDRPLCLCTPLQGEYGFADGCLSIPCRLGEDGIEETIEWDLPETERQELQTAHAAIGKTLPTISRD